VKSSARTIIFAVVIAAALLAGFGIGQKSDSVKPDLDREILALPGARPSALPFSSGVRVGNFVFLSGMIGTDLKTNELVSPDVGGQTRQCLEKIKQVLNQAGMDLGNAVSASVYLTDLKDYDEMNKAYGAYFPKNAPARACVQVANLVRGAKVEISVIAAK
jgi:2-iminobutanoate/2-iminopropanoate deaminase